MNPGDNIKNFFQSRLSESMSEGEEWNTPSDDIWESAKVNFPKEDKSRRTLILWLGGIAGLLLISGLAFKQLNNSQQQKITKSDQSATKSLIEDIATIETSSNSTSQSNELESNSNSNGTEHSTNLSLTTNLNQSNINKNRKDSEIKLAGQTNDLNLKSSTDLNELSLNSNVYETNGSENTNKQQIEPKNTNTKNSEVTNLVQTTSTQPNSKTAITSIKTETLLSTEQKLLDINYIPITPIEFLDHSRGQNISAEHITIPLQRNKKWEIGLSTSPLIIPIQKLINADTIDNDITNMEFNYFGLNIPVTRIINNKWSISSGLYYKQGNIKATFEDEETLDIGDNISLMFDDNSSAASISIEDKSQEISINLKPDVEIIDGDVITANGFGQLDFNVIQIPLLANYHIRKNRSEFIFSLGASIDLARIEISDFDISLSKNNSIITEPINFTAFGTNLVDYSIFGGIGTKYHFNENINLSYSLKADLTGIIFSTHEIGIHYRF